tara:strand:- start:5459 stop:6727 length:1269 start_codon:yes stop_codon:yes gene_type:complete
MIKQFFLKLVDGFIYGLGFLLFSGVIGGTVWLLLPDYKAQVLTQKAATLPVVNKVVPKKTVKEEAPSHIVKRFDAPRITVPDDYTFITVSDTRTLNQAISAARKTGGRYAIELADGHYNIGSTINIDVNHIMLMSKSGNPYDVTLNRGGRGNLLRVSADHFYVDGITLTGSGNHLIQVAGESEASYTKINNCIFYDAKEQFIKVSYDRNKPDSKSYSGNIANSIFEFRRGIAFQYYTGGIDVLGGVDWLVENNIFKDIASPSKNISQHAVHFWANSEGTRVVNNLFIDVDRAIGFGMPLSKNKKIMEYSHNNGMIVGNVIFHSDNGDPFGDTGIVLESNINTLVKNNTVYFEHHYPNAIEYRFSNTESVTISGNQTNRAITSRDGASAELSDNVTTLSQAEFFKLFSEISDRLGVVTLSKSS